MDPVSSGPSPFIIDPLQSPPQIFEESWKNLGCNSAGLDRWNELARLYSEPRLDSQSSQPGPNSLNRLTQYTKYNS